MSKFKCRKKTEGANDERRRRLGESPAPKFSSLRNLDFFRHLNFDIRHLWMHFPNQGGEQTMPASQQEFSIRPIGHVRSSRDAAVDDFWGGTVARIELDPAQFDASALAGLAEFSHVQILYVFDRVDPTKLVMAAEHPRENPAWPRVGIFAQRKKSRPNRLGLSTCRLVSVAGLSITVAELDAIDGTPVVDIKPYVLEFEPRREDVRQPKWMSELMVDYFKKAH
jgi:tRNA-Thr(GGU) m(6)t(6)A37 methyltransferase TsaA